MPANVLQNVNDPMFSFEHAMQHRALLAAMAPLSNFSTIPYGPLDPPSGMGQTGGMWQTLHAQAHQDFISALPSYYGASSTGGLETGQILIDLQPDNPGQQAWWTFANHWEHYIANQTILPLSMSQAYPYPYW